jgi:hypothetical protein
MLFDLQSRGRRNAVKVIYTGLAILMGGGLLLFGIGTGTNSNGFLDLLKGNGTSQKAQVSAAQKRAERAVRLHPTVAAAWADLARQRYAGAAYDQNQQAFTANGRIQLASAAKAWQRYLQLNPRHPDPAIARMMATAYSQVGLNQPVNAAAALEIVSAAQPSAANYGALAQFAYQAGETRKGDLAASKAVALAPKTQRKLVQQQLATVKKQAVTQAVQKAAGQGATTTPSG